MNKEITLDDPRLTAYALGDLVEDAERLEIESALRQDAALKDYVEEIRCLEETLRGEFAKEEALPLNREISRSARSMRRGWHYLLPAAGIVGVAACVALFAKMSVEEEQRPVVPEVALLTQVDEQEERVEAARLRMLDEAERAGLVHLRVDSTGSYEAVVGRGVVLLPNTIEQFRRRVRARIVDLESQLAAFDSVEGDALIELAVNRKVSDPTLETLYPRFTELREQVKTSYGDRRGNEAELEMKRAMLVSAIDRYRDTLKAELERARQLSDRRGYSEGLVGELENRERIAGQNYLDAKNEHELQANILAKLQVRSAPVLESQEVPLEIPDLLAQADEQEDRVEAARLEMLDRAERAGIVDILVDVPGAGDPVVGVSAQYLQSMEERHRIRVAEALERWEVDLQALQDLEGDRLVEAAAKIDLDDPTMTKIYPGYAELRERLKEPREPYAMLRFDEEVFEMQQVLLVSAIKRYEDTVTRKLSIAKHSLSRSSPDNSLEVRRKVAAYSEAKKEYALQANILAEMQSKLGLREARWSFDRFATQRMRVHIALSRMIDLAVRYQIHDVNLRERFVSGPSLWREARMQVEALDGLSGRELIEEAAKHGLQNSLLIERWPEYKALSRGREKLLASGLSASHPEVVRVAERLQECEGILIGAVMKELDTLKNDMAVVESAMKDTLPSGGVKSIQKRRERAEYEEARREYELEKAKLAKMRRQAPLPDAEGEAEDERQFSEREQMLDRAMRMSREDLFLKGLRLMRRARQHESEGEVELAKAAASHAVLIYQVMGSYSGLPALAKLRQDEAFRFYQRLGLQMREMEER